MGTGNNQTSQGFTIVEILIVVAIMGLLLTEAIIAVSGDTNNGAFVVGTNSLKQQMEQLITETAKGYYPDNGGFTCDSSTAPVTISSTPSGNPQGSNYGCIFLGKVIQFSPGGSSNQYTVIPVTGNQFVGGATPLTLSQADPVLIPSLSASQTLQYGLKIVSLLATGSGGPQSTTAIGLMAGDSAGVISSNDTSGNLNSDSQSLSLYYDNNSSLGASPATLTSDVLDKDMVPTSHVAICVSGGNNQSGLIQIGNSGNLTVSLTIWSDSTC